MPKTSWGPRRRLVRGAGGLSFPEEDRPLTRTGQCVHEVDADVGERLTHGEDYEVVDTHVDIKDDRGRSVSGYCMVCEMQFQDGDDVVECPFCENFAHRTHMVSWLQKEGTCPVGKQLSESEFIK